eukprot:gene12242-3524_t
MPAGRRAAGSIVVHHTDVDVDSLSQHSSADGWNYTTWRKNVHESPTTPPPAGATVIGVLVRRSKRNENFVTELEPEWAARYVEFFQRIKRRSGMNIEFVVCTVEGSAGQRHLGTFRPRHLRKLVEFRCGNLENSACKFCTLSVEFCDSWLANEASAYAIFDFWADVERINPGIRRVMLSALPRKHDFFKQYSDTPHDKFLVVPFDVRNQTIWPHNVDCMSWQRNGVVAGRRCV